MPSLIRYLLIYSMISQPCFAASTAPRPLFNKKETLSFVQKHQRGTISKKDLIVLLEKRSISSAKDKKIIQQLKAENFQKLSWSLVYENNQIIMNIQEPQVLHFTITELDRLFSAAIINGELINLKSNLAELTRAFEKVGSPSKSVFNLLFIERAEALVWFVPVLGAVAIIALFGSAAAMSGDEQKIEAAFTKILNSCQKDVANKLSSPSSETLSSLKAIKEFGYDPDTITWYNSQQECLDQNGERYSKKFCQTSADTNHCFKSLSAPVSPATPASGTSVGGTN